MPPTLSTIAIARDISERERLATRHEEFLDFLDDLDVAYFRSSLNGQSLRSNEADARITGYSAEEWKRLSKNVLYANPTDRIRLVELVRQHDGKLRRHLLELRRKSGEPFWAEVDLRILADPDGNEELEGFFRDVTDQMILQRYLEGNDENLISQSELLRQLKEATELQIDYVSSIGHQIQAPLGSLLGTLEKLQRETARGSRLHLRLPVLIGQLKNVSRLVRNLSLMDTLLRRRPIRVEQVRLARLILEVLVELSAALQKSRFHIDEYELKKNLDIVFGHRELLRQVLVNLLDNALKYSAPYSSIFIRSEEKEGRPVLTIWNRGLSIPPTVSRKLFSRGFRAPQAKALVPHGTGLGLWLVREILKLHRAEIRHFEAREDGHLYNVFEITFPYADIAEARNPAHE